MLKLSLCALVYREDNFWIAHCLELDLVAEGNTLTESFENLLDLVELWLETDNFFRSAPIEIFMAFATGHTCIMQRQLPECITQFDVREIDS